MDLSPAQAGWQGAVSDAARTSIEYLRSLGLDFLTQRLRVSKLGLYVCNFVLCPAAEGSEAPIRSAKTRPLPRPAHLDMALVPWPLDAFVVIGRPRHAAGSLVGRLGQVLGPRHFAVPACGEIAPRLGRRTPTKV